ncbi:phosphotransferase RcsD [Biostraticola tofi]|uniref:Phosphotransferase RcsD n=1 Tax=Biostraticola tofi TaxID=466109 RepID=A0A4R3Z898_9GAMM|nr:phosphotransferase RcsD [Biostraticola tofi]TCW00290.1 two-component system sensor histidine kinase RcsD [Biostraticola tofi]
MKRTKNVFFTSTALSRGFMAFIVMLLLALWLFCFHTVNAYLVERKHNLNTISNAIQKRIDNYRFVAYQLYESNIGASAVADAANGAQETRLRPDVYYVEKPHKKTDALIFGSHENASFSLAIAMSGYLDILWGSETNNYSMYYLNGSDNSLTLISTQPLRDITPRFKDSYISALVDSRRAEMLAQANVLDERESFSPLRKHRFQNDYYLTQRIIFNQPGHLPTVIAFDLPINDVIPLNMARANFSLVTSNDNSAADEGDEDSGLYTQSRINGSHLEFSVPFANSPLTLVYRVPMSSLVLDMMRNNFWLIAIDLLLLALAMAGLFLVRRNFLHPSDNMASAIESQQALSNEVITNLPLGLLVYNFSTNQLIASNKIADHLLPHLSLQKIANLAESHQGIIQATVNNEVYEIRTFKSQLSPNTWLFQLLDQDKEVLVNKKLQQAQRELNKNHQARRSILKNLQNELDEPLVELNMLIDQLDADYPEADADLAENQGSAASRASTDEATSVVSTQRPAGERRQWVGQLRLQSRSLGTMFENICLLNSIESGEYKSNPERFLPQQLLETLLKSRLPQIRQKGLDLFSHYRLPYGQLYVGDAEALAKALLLVIDYAIITTHFGKIETSVDRDPQREGHLLFTVSDTGQGIGREELANVEQPFISPAQADHYRRGSGLSWFLCDQLCKKMGGRLEIRSHDGIGTLYTLQLALPEADEENEAGENILDDTLVLLDIANEQVRRITSDMLSRWGAECLYADEQHLAQEHDLLITDDISRLEDFAILLDGHESGILSLTPRRMRANHNLAITLLDAILQLIELRLGQSDNLQYADFSPSGDFESERKQLSSGDYYTLFAETVPDDVKRLYTEAEKGDLPALAQTAHRLKGVFAMLDLEPGKQLCETLEQHIKQQDHLIIGNKIREIDDFVTKLLQHAR